MPAGRLVKYSLMLLLLPFLVACHNETVREKRVVLAEVDSVRLYADEVHLQLAARGGNIDSALFVKEYIDRWATEELFYKKASQNIASTDEIEKMVDNYRKNLILSIYQERLVNQHLKPSISVADIERFYDSNKMLFEADESMFKGLLLVIPAKSPKVAKVRAWCLDKTPENLEEIERYSAEHALKYEYFMDEWRLFEDVAKMTPLTEFQLFERLSRKSTIEFKDDGNIYFVCADTLIRKGDSMPVELVSGELNELLINSRKASFIKEKKKALLDEAIKEGRVKIYNE